MAKSKFLSAGQLPLTSAKMRILDRNSEYLGISTLQLMENSGRAVADAVSSRFPRGSSIVILGGVGRNGGDGMVAARHLAARGFDVTYLLVGDEGALRDESVLRNWKILKAMSWSVKVEVLKDSSQIAERECDVAVDALLGTGAKGALRQPILRAVQVLNSLKCFKLAIDVPTGIDSDTGEVLGEAVKADLTVTLHAVKAGLGQAKEYCGEIEVVDIGIPPEAELYAGPGDVEAVMKPRPPEAHKGQFGRLLVIGGSETYTGAPALVALAGLRTGVDLVFVASPEKTAYTVASFSPNLITIKLRGESFGTTSLPELKPHVERADAVAIGPGLGTRKETVTAVHELIKILQGLKKPTLIDADGLKALGILEAPLQLPAVLTPHPREFEIISGKKPSADLSQRMEDVRSLAEKVGGTVLLKGNIDVISDGDAIKLNHTGNPGMTVGGTGDVLSGIVSGLMAQGINPFEAAVAGAFINGAAGDLAYTKLGYHLAPTDLIRHIPAIMNNPMIHRTLRA